HHCGLGALLGDERTHSLACARFAHPQAEEREAFISPVLLRLVQQDLRPVYGWLPVADRDPCPEGVPEYTPRRPRRTSRGGDWPEDPRGLHPGRGQRLLLRQYTAAGRFLPRAHRRGGKKGGGDHR